MGAGRGRTPLPLAAALVATARVLSLDAASVRDKALFPRHIFGATESLDATFARVDAARRAARAEAVRAGTYNATLSLYTRTCTLFYRPDLPGAPEQARFPRCLPRGVRSPLGAALALESICYERPRASRAEWWLLDDDLAHQTPHKAGSLSHQWMHRLDPAARELVPMRRRRIFLQSQTCQRRVHRRPRKPFFLRNRTKVASVREPLGRFPGALNQVLHATAMTGFTYKTEDVWGYPVLIAPGCEARKPELLASFVSGLVGNASTRASVGRYGHLHQAVDAAEMASQFWEMGCAVPPVRAPTAPQQQRPNRAEESKQPPKPKLSTANLTHVPLDAVYHLEGLARVPPERTPPLSAAAPPPAQASAKAKGARGRRPLRPAAGGEMPEEVRAQLRSTTWRALPALTPAAPAAEGAPPPRAVHASGTLLLPHLHAGATHAAALSAEQRACVVSREDLGRELQRQLCAHYAQDYVCFDYPLPPECQPPSSVRVRGSEQ